MNALFESRLKLRRAWEHLQNLNTNIVGFFESNPYSFELQPNPKPPYYVLRARINQSPPVEWSCIVGDFAHNARSSLDLLVHEHSRLSAEDTKRLRLGFPIYDSAKQYARAENRCLSGVPAIYRNIIEEFQPYHCPDEFQKDPLACLRNINNADKHRLIHVVGAIADLSHFEFDGSSGLPDWVRFEAGASIRVERSFDFGDGFRGTKLGNGEIVEDGTIVATMTIPREETKVRPKERITILFHKSVAEIQGQPVISTLTSIHERVKEVMNAFESALPGKGPQVSPE